MTPSFNGSVRVELSGQRTTSDSGALLLREALDSSGVMPALEQHLVDPRDPQRVRHSLASQLRTVVLQRAMDGIDLSDTTTLRRDPLWQLACSDARGTTPVAQDRPSQATLSRLLRCLGSDDNIDVVHEGLLRLAIWRLSLLRRGERPKRLTLDIDGLPIEVFGHQGGSAFHGHVGLRIYSPLIASLAETGDMLREGNAGPAENADTWIPHLVRRLNEGLGAEARVRIDAGFTDNDTLEALEDRSIEYLGRLRSHSGLQALVAPYFRFDWPPERVLALYRQRGSAEAHMGEVKSALGVHLSSTDRGDSTVQDVMARNEVSLLMSLYAYQVLHGLRRLLESRTHHGWSLQRMREQVLKVAAIVDPEIKTLV
jgi:hypothetical protein